MEHIEKVEEKEMVHDSVKLEWHRSHLIYVVFLVVYLVVEFPAMRIGVAYIDNPRGQDLSKACRLGDCSGLGRASSPANIPICLGGRVSIEYHSLDFAISLSPPDRDLKGKGQKNYRREERTNPARSRGEVAGIEKAGHHAKCEKCEERDQGDVADC